MEITNDKNAIPLLRIWTEPRKTIRRVVEEDAEGTALALAAGGGIVNVLDMYADRGPGANLGLLLLVILIGTVLGVLAMYFTSAVMRWIGRWFGGQAEAEEIRIVFAWSNVPLLPLLALWVVLLGRYGIGLLTGGIDGGLGIEDGVLMVIYAVATVVLNVWVSAIFVVGLSEVQKFSVWKAFACVLIPILILLVPVTLIAVLAIP
jgi:hypothetical protein